MLYKIKRQNTSSLKAIKKSHQKSAYLKQIKVKQTNIGSEYAKALSNTLSEWKSENDEKAYSALLNLF